MCGNNRNASLPPNPLHITLTLKGCWVCMCWDNSGQDNERKPKVLLTGLRIPLTESVYHAIGFEWFSGLALPYLYGQTWS